MESLSSDRVLPRLAAFVLAGTLLVGCPGGGGGQVRRDPQPWDLDVDPLPSPRPARNPLDGRGQCRCQGRASAVMFLSNAQCANECGGADRVGVWPDATDAVDRAIEQAGGGVPPVGPDTQCPPQPARMRTVRVGRVPFTIFGTDAQADDFEAFLGRFRADCLGQTIWASLAARFRGAGFDEGMQVNLDDGYAHSTCDGATEHDRAVFSTARGAYDGYAKMRNPVTGDCEHVASSLWVRAGGTTRFDDPQTLETLAHELTHAAYDHGGPTADGLVEGEYCAHLAGWMVASRLSPSPRAALDMETHLYPDLVTPGTCGYVSDGWRDELRQMRSVEGTGGRLAAYVRRCAGYPEGVVFPGTEDSTVCGASDSSCCPFEPQAAGCRQSWRERIVTR